MAVFPIFTLPLKTYCLKYRIAFVLLLFSASSGAQQMFTTDGSNVYEHNGIGNGICTETSLGHFCIVDSTSLFSLAYHQDTLYVITTESDLYQIDLSHPSSCRFLTNFDMPPQETPRM